MAAITSITVTGKVGPGNTATAVVVAGATAFSVDVVRQMLYVTGPGVYREFDISAATTFTVAIAATNYTITIS